MRFGCYGVNSVANAAVCPENSCERERVDEFSRSRLLASHELRPRTQVVKGGVCKTPMRGCKSHRGLKISDRRNITGSRTCNLSPLVLASKFGTKPLFRGVPDWTCERSEQLSVAIPHRTLFWCRTNPLRASIFSMENILPILTTIFGAGMSFGYYPQIFKILKHKSSRDVSLTTYLIFFPGILVWLVYGFSIANLPIIIANTFATLGCFLAIVACIAFRKRDAP